MSSLFELVEGFESSLDMLSCGLGVLEAIEQTYDNKLFIREFDYHRRALLCAIANINAQMESMAFLVDDLTKLNKEYELVSKNA